VTGRHGLALDVIGLIKHRGQLCRAVTHSRRGAAGALYGHELAHGSFGQAKLGEHVSDLVDLTPKAEQYEAGDVGVLGVAREGPPQIGVAIACFAHAAAGAVAQGNNAVNVGVVGESGTAKLVSNIARGGR